MRNLFSDYEASMKRLVPLLRILGISLLLFIVLTVIMFEVSQVILPRTSIPASDLTPTSLAGVKRILILAPHSDDETLGPGGLIQAAVQAGIQVQVVIATNGDGYQFATSQEFRKLYPTAKDYIRMGEVRQQESLAALAKLGVPPENVHFLGYPDRGTMALWQKNWSASTPYKSPYIRANHSPYRNTYNPDSVYAGEDLLADIESIINGYRPDLVIYPHPEDVHPDHWGLNAFTRLALTEISHRNPAYQPKQLTYLVHRPDYPVQKGLRPAANLVPPPALYAIYQNWVSWPLTPDQVNVKGQAIQAYKSQLPLLRGLMQSFVRSNELFAPVASTDISTVVSGKPLDPSTWQDSLGHSIPPVQLDPTGDILSHKAVPETDLKAVYTARTPAGDLWMCAQLYDEGVRQMSYSLRLKALTDTDIISYEAHTNPKRGQVTATRSGVYFCARTSLADLGNPWAVTLAATVESPNSIMPFDQSAWQVVYVGR
jgi:LmbE family N-acetylglucosaminyl deacetylase